MTHTRQIVGYKLFTVWPNGNIKEDQQPTEGAVAKYGSFDLPKEQ